MAVRSGKALDFIPSLFGKVGMAEQAHPSRPTTIASRVQAWDVKWYRRINGWKGKAAGFLKHYTHVASSPTWSVLMVAMFFIAWLGRVPFAWSFVKYAFANVSSIFIILAIKFKINRIRPCFVLDNVTVRTAPRFYKGPSLPSGHVQFFTSNMLVLTTIVSQFAGAGVWFWMLPLLLAMAVLVALSRVYVGVHYPTDVLAGLASGTIIYLLTVFLTLPLWNIAFTWIDAMIH
jgi:undecaprenyl-diphosphatase